MKFLDSATAKAALISSLIGGFISVITVMLTVWLPAHLEGPQLKEDNTRLHAELMTKNHQIAELQTLLVPFKTVAFQNFTGTEAERLSQLALKLNDVQKGLESLSNDQAAIREKTNAIVTLPDGRINMGGMITGTPTKLDALLKKLVDAYNSKDFQTGYEISLEFDKMFDDSEKAAQQAGLSLSGWNAEVISEMFRVASDCARISRHFEKGLVWAKKSVAQKDSGQGRAGLVACSMLLNDYTEAHKVLRESLQKDDETMVREFREAIRRLGVALPDPLPGDYQLPHN